MSSETQPISLERFAEAITELTLPSLHAKAAELRNSMFHLRRSNLQLQPFADEGDGDCADAIKENDATIQSMESRVELLRVEVVERRGMPWVEDPAAQQQKESVNGEATQQSDEMHGDTNATTENATAPRDGTDGTGRSAGHGTTEQSANTRRESSGREPANTSSESIEEEGLHL
ncbi:hypothetical protein IWZ00DRAFT_488611 [Phyllosticta capitalensis]|uniref:Uncharacterized protein n=1 Tax=Phyllosticta capitalensis TaxID=121624 RepID=A0ABR1YUS3_9PEZI